MTYSDTEIRDRLRPGEDSNWELKAVEFAGDRPIGPSRGDLADEIAAFANAAGGVLVLGVTDDGRPQGMSRPQIIEMDSLVVEASSDSIRPAVRIRTHHRELDGRRFLLVEVPRGDSQHETPGGSYIRVGGTKRKMTSEERLRLAQGRGQARIRSFDEQTVPGTGFGTLDEALWKPMLCAEGAAEPRSALIKLAVLAEDDDGILRATVAGVLLCTRNPEQWLPNASIAATLYRGTDRASGHIDAQDITGPLNRQIGYAAAFASRNMRVASRKDPARVNMPQYSDKALFEAIVNAVVHRDYSMRGGRIRLSMFEDRLEVQSPGSLPNNLTLDSMSTRQATRNEALTSILARIPVGGIRGSQDRQYIMERRGDGVPIIMRETRELSGRDADYRLIDGAELLLTIPAASLEHDPARATITVRSAGHPLPGCDVLALFPNKAWNRATTDERGEAVVDLYATSLPMTVFTAAPGYQGHVQRGWVPCQGPLAVEMASLPRGGSTIFAESGDRLPVVRGRLSPISDSFDRTCLYAPSISINQGMQQPVYFALGEDLRVTDAEGVEAMVRVIDLVGESALVEYGPFPEA